MKKYFFDRGEYSKEFFLYTGAYGKRRETLGKDEDHIVHYLKNRLDPKRKSEFYILKGSVDEITLKNIRKLFSGSKINVKLENKF